MARYVFLATKGPLHDDHGQVFGMFGISRDITERKRAEAALQDSEATNQLLLASMADGMFVAQDRRFVFVNAALPRMLGYEGDALAGLPFSAVVAPDFLPTWLRRFEARVSEGPEPLSRYEVQFMRSGGQQRLWVELRANRFRYHGRPAVLGLIRDTSERRQSEQSLREASELIQAVEDSVLDHMAVIDREGRIVNVNAAWTQFARDFRGPATGLSQRSAVGSDYLEACRSAAQAGDALAPNALPQASRPFWSTARRSSATSTRASVRTRSAGST